MIDQLPTPLPSPTDSPEEFDAHAFQLVGALPAFVSQANALASAVNADAAAAAADAATATSKATAAAGSATAASGSATNAGNSATAASGSATLASSKAGEASASAASAAASAAAALGQIFATGTQLMFVQAAAPVGWTRVTDDTANNRMLRVVNSGGGGGVGGSHSPTINNVVPAHTHGFTTGGESSDHGHSIGDPGHAHSVSWQSGTSLFLQNSGQVAPGGITGYSATGVFTYGVTANHTHSGGTDNGSSQTNWTPRYVDLILCRKN